MREATHQVLQPCWWPVAFLLQLQNNPLHRGAWRCWEVTLTLTSWLVSTNFCRRRLTSLCSTSLCQPCRGRGKRKSIILMPGRISSTQPHASSLQVGVCAGVQHPGRRHSLMLQDCIGGRFHCSLPVELSSPPQWHCAPSPPAKPPPPWPPPALPPSRPGPVKLPSVAPPSAVFACPGHSASLGWRRSVKKGAP